MLAEALMGVAAGGVAACFAGWRAVQRFAGRPAPGAGPCPPVSVLKPVCGDEALLEDAIESFCRQDYPAFQLVIGARDADDPGLAAARRVMARHPGADIAIVTAATPHGSNRKIANLINMLPAARHDVLVIADSDLHVRADYLRRIVAELRHPGCGLVTTICAAEPVARRIVPLLGMHHIAHAFLPAALLAARCGRQDCLGGTMALHRATLQRIGGLAALANHLADDNRLGRLVRQLGLSVRIAATLPVMVVQERRLRALWQHELRWARTIRAVAPLGCAGWALQLPMLWAMLAVACAGAAPWSLAGFGAIWAARAALVLAVDRSLRATRARAAPRPALWLLPLRDLLSASILAAAFWSDEVVWRGQVMRADTRARRPLNPAQG